MLLYVIICYYIDHDGGDVHLITSSVTVWSISSVRFRRPAATLHGRHMAIPAARQGASAGYSAGWLTGCLEVYWSNIYSVPQIYTYIYIYILIHMCIKTLSMLPYWSPYVVIFYLLRLYKLNHGKLTNNHWTSCSPYNPTSIQYTVLGIARWDVSLDPFEPSAHQSGLNHNFTECVHGATGPAKSNAPWMYKAFLNIDPWKGLWHRMSAQSLLLVLT